MAPALHPGVSCINGNKTLGTVLLTFNRRDLSRLVSLEIFSSWHVCRGASGYRPGDDNRRVIRFPAAFWRSAET
jgi:hypothetical protein